MPDHTCTTAVPCSQLGANLHVELCRAKRVLDTQGPIIAIYGSARTPEHDIYYKRAVALAESLATAGLPVMSGGGPGIMEAANRGAQSPGTGKSIGLNITLGHEPQPNAFQDHSLIFDHFSSRKAVFCKYAAAFIVFPGGLGTLDELFEVATLLQTGKTRPAPVILYGVEFWQPLVAWLHDQLLPRGLISPEDMNLFLMDDDVSRITDLCQAAARGWHPAD